MYIEQYANYILTRHVNVIVDVVDSLFSIGVFVGVVSSMSVLSVQYIVTTYQVYWATCKLYTNHIEKRRIGQKLVKCTESLVGRCGSWFVGTRR